MEMSIIVAVEMSTVPFKTFKFAAGIPPRGDRASGDVCRSIWLSDMNEDGYRVT